MNWMPHRHCLGGDTWPVWVLTVEGLLITAIYLSIAVLLWRYLRRAPLARRAGTGMAAIFATCGLDRLVGVLCLFWPWYYALILTKTLTVLVGANALIQLVRWRIAVSAERVETAVNQAEQRSAAQRFVDSLPFPAFVASPDGGNLATNTECDELLGTTQAQVDGWLWERNLHSEGRNKFAREWRDYCAKRSEQNEFVFRWVRPVDAVEIWARTMAEFSPEGWIWGRVEDITRRVDLEESEDAFRRKFGRR